MVAARAGMRATKLLTTTRNEVSVIVLTVKAWQVTLIIVGKNVNKGSTRQIEPPPLRRSMNEIPDRAE
jgi:hypothetical protein